MRSPGRGRTIRREITARGVPGAARVCDVRSVTWQGGMGPRTRRGATAMTEASLPVSAARTQRFSSSARQPSTMVRSSETCVPATSNRPSARRKSRPNAPDTAPKRRNTMRAGPVARPVGVDGRDGECVGADQVEQLAPVAPPDREEAARGQSACGGPARGTSPRRPPGAPTRWSCTRSTGRRARPIRTARRTGW